MPKSPFLKALNKNQKKMERLYSYKDVDMLIGARVVGESFKKYKDEIIAIRSRWADPFIDDYELNVNTVIDTHLGIDAKSLQKLATHDINALQKEAGKKLSLFKTLITVDFSSDKVRKQWILDTLGFTRHLKSVQNNSHEDLIQLLSQFKENMTPELKAEITDKGMGEALIDGIISMAETVREADVTQEKLKEDSKTHTEEAVKEFNTIYEQAIGICKIGHQLFNDDKLKAEHFSFSHIIKAMRHTKKAESE